MSEWQTEWIAWTLFMGFIHWGMEGIHNSIISLIGIIISCLTYFSLGIDYWRNLINTFPATNNTWVRGVWKTLRLAWFFFFTVDEGPGSSRPVTGHPPLEILSENNQLERDNQIPAGLLMEFNIRQLLENISFATEKSDRSLTTVWSGVWY